MSKILLVDAPGPFRDSLLAAVQARGADAIALDDGMDALASIHMVEPDVILIGEDPGAPGALSLSRILSRERAQAQVYRLGELGDDGVLPSSASLLSKALGASGLAAAMLLSEAPAGPDVADAIELAPRGLPGLLLALCDRHATGVLTLVGKGIERELSLVRGVPVAGASNLLDERLGAIATASGHIDELTLRRALAHSRDRGVPLGQSLLEIGAMAGDDLHRLLGAQLRVRMTSACAAGPWRASFVARPGLAGELALLPTEPMVAVLAAVRRESKPRREEAFGALAGMPVRVGTASPSVDRWLRALGIDVATSIDGASSYGAMLDSLAVTSDSDEEIDAEALALSLTWVGRIAPAGEFPDRAAAFAPVLCELPTMAERVVAAPDAAGSALERRLLRPSPGAMARGRALHGSEAEADEAAAELHALYLTLKGQRDPRRVLGAAQNASHTEIRRAYHARLEQLDQHASGAAAEGSLALELRGRVEQARAQILPAEAEPLSLRGAAEDDEFEVLSIPPDPPVPAPAGPLSVPPPLPSERARADAPQVLSEPPASHAGGPPIGKPGSRDGHDGHDGHDGEHAKSPPPLPAVRVTRGDLEPVNAGSGVPDAVHGADGARGAQAAGPMLTAEELAETEAILEQGNWAGLLQTLDAREGEPRDLPAPLRLLYAIALREVATTEPQGTRRPRRSSPEVLGKTAVGELMQVPTDSATVRIVARRVLRRRPLEWQQPPSRGVSFILTAIALAIGVGGGLIFSGEIFELLWK